MLTLKRPFAPSAPLDVAVAHPWKVRRLFHIGFFLRINPFRARDRELLKFLAD